MTITKNAILNKTWMSRGAGWTLKADWAPDQGPNYAGYKKEVVPRYGTVFTCVDAPDLELPGFTTKSHWLNSQGDIVPVTNGPKDIVVPCVKFTVAESDSLPAGIPAPDEDDPFEPPRDKMDPSYVESFQEVIFRVADDHLIAPMTKIMYKNNAYKATMIITFDSENTMTLRSYWEDGYFGGYCCPNEP